MVAVRVVDNAVLEEENAFLSVIDFSLKTAFVFYLVTVFNVVMSNFRRCSLKSKRRYSKFIGNR